MKKEELDSLRPTIRMALEKASNYCAYQERCQKEVRNKLYELKLDADDVEEVLYLLIKEDFLNEERYSKLYCRSKFNQNGWGKNKITQKLKLNNISERNISTGLKEINSEAYYQHLEKVIKKKRDSIIEKNHWTKKNKIIQHAMQKGFEFELIKEFI